MNIRASMYRIVFTLVVLPFLLFSLLITGIYSDRLEKAITDSLHVVADAQVTEMNNFCVQQKDYLTMIGAMDAFRAAMEGTLDQDTLVYLDNILYSRVLTMGYVDSLAVVDSERRVVACSQAHSYYASAGFEGLIEYMEGQDFYISDLLTSVRGPSTLVAIARIEDGGRLLGYIMAELNPDFYKDIRESAQLWGESTFYLLDGKQRIISAGTPEETRDAFITSEGDRADYIEKYNSIDFTQAPRGSFQYEVAGRQYISYYSDIEHTDWRFMLSVSLDNYQAQRTVYHVLTIFTVLLCVVLAVWIGSFASRRIVRPIQRISATLRAIQEKQDYSLRIQVERKDELGSLAADINGLVDFIETEDLYKAQQQRLLLKKAGQDALTKVLNKESLDQHLQETVARHRAEGSAMAILFVDIDDFKSFNTEYGHIVGDQVLLFLSSLLTKETGGTVGRAGGDEFLVVVEDPQCLEGLDMYLRRVEEIAGSRFLARGSGIHLPITCSIGAVRVDFSSPAAGALTPEQLVDLADMAMYQIKNSGKHGHIIRDYP